ncbi:hypothetical protein KIPB_000672 [Kipferlia bialata]|uniref:Uncharacterized protein n=1 Tax=Kipferlia bialata TaxID=797122 RepID=A0A9K3CPJ3_9EUKA|nr:hypothetical protein KIPB_000672 [Kipferlia bialata]|eukprot:g672.t1
MTEEAPQLSVFGILREALADHKCLCLITLVVSLVVASAVCEETSCLRLALISDTDAVTILGVPLVTPTALAGPVQHISMPPIVSRAPYRPCMSAAFDPDNSECLVVSDGETLVCVNSGSGETTHTFKHGREEPYINDITFVPGSRGVFATCDSGGRILKWSLDSTEPLGVHGEMPSVLEHVSVLPNHGWCCPQSDAGTRCSDNHPLILTNSLGRFVISCPVQKVTSECYPRDIAPPRIAADKGTYEGEWLNGMRHGYGTCVIPPALGDQAYTGEWKEDLRSGFGVMTYGDGTIYRGQWKNDFASGYGCMTFPSDGDEIRGQFLTGMQDGYAVCTRASGEVYEGEWVKGKRCGHAKVTHPNGTVTEGEYKDNKPCGVATCVFDNGDMYEGGYIDDKMCGHGTLTRADGSMYEGEWKDNMRHGYGVTHHADGGVYKGDYKEDKRWGHGIISAYGGGVVEGEWVNNVLVGEVTMRNSRGTYTGEHENGLLLCKQLRDQLFQSIVMEYIKLPFGAALGDLSVDYGNVPVDSDSTRILYLPNTGVLSLTHLCESLRTLSLSVVNLCTVKSPSALKRILASDPRVVVCTYDFIHAVSGTKTYKLHLGLWRELARNDTTARVFMCLDEDEVYENEQEARERYTDLARLLKAQYVDKLSEAKRNLLWDAVDTLQCIPLYRYFEDVWGGVKLEE